MTATALPSASEVTSAPIVIAPPVSTSKIPETATGVYCSASVSTSQTPYALAPAWQTFPSSPTKRCCLKSASAVTESINSG